ncbi:SapB/AmfS family lanthipeptide [Nocardiopsis sp. FIRDI 009]|nr:SapB/AmfS family lanthipeptide [Nocardiopsis sp. FIRDI 009]
MSYVLDLQSMDSAASGDAPASWSPGSTISSFGCFSTASVALC